ncbi:phospholipid carrier-dependent glycosyltransferase [Arthrobacter sp. fls2-241-R2A-200]|uniref:ArnT family glycosyltransferase n=1 Tax=unclassified Arthrobacter TaxID=235627 RepID=UPI00254DF3A9|nr:phospholipid carrier-dependent glycosyltransferase [Arthrobacter sp. fls2-241-R2A-200]
MQDAAQAVTEEATHPRHRQTAPVRGSMSPPVMARLRGFCVFAGWVAAAFGVRAIGLTKGFELWVDEMLYALLGDSVSRGHILPTLPDGPFFLHPPGFFWVEGAVIHLFGITGNNVDLVMQLRWLNAVLGAVTVGLAFLLVRHTANRTAAWLTGGLLSFEPFVLRSNSHVFLETLAMAAVLGGLLIVVTQMGSRSTGKRTLLLVLAGLLLGYSVLTKDFFALCTVVPVGAATVWRQTLRRREAAGILSAMLLPYLIYMSIVVGQGMFPDWLRAKTAGIMRLIGVQKDTGFSAAGSPSLVSRLIDNASHFGSSYILLGLCPVAATLLCLSRRPERRLIGLISLSLGVYGVYSAVFGTFEEQYGYGVMIAGVLSIAVLSAEVFERGRRSLRSILLVSAVLLLLLTTVLGVRLETSTDNGFAQARRWVQENLPAQAKVSVTNDTGELAFADDPRFGVWPSPSLMLGSGANYVLTASLPASQGYAYMDPGMLPWLEKNAKPVFSVAGLTNGTTTLWFVDTATLDAGVRAGVR